MAKDMKPAAPGSTPPQGPKTPAATLYPNGGFSGKTDPPRGGDTSDPWRGNSIQTAGNGSVPTKGAVPVKKAEPSDGDQGKHNRHRKGIKATGTDAQMRNTESVTSTKALKKGGMAPASTFYPSSKKG